MKSRTFFSAIALIAGLLVLVGVVGFWGLTLQNPRGLLTKGGQAVPTAAQFVPRQAPMMMSLLARPDRLWQLRQVLTPAGKRYEARQEWQSLKATLTDLVGWDYDVDVRPWLDEEITFAVTTPDLDYDGSNGQQTGYLVVLTCRDGQKAREAIHLLWQKRAIAGKNLVFETVSGVPLIYDQTPANSPFERLNLLDPAGLKLDTLAAAVISDRYVLLANHPQVLRQAIATFQAPDVSLASADPFRTSLKTLPPRRIGWLYANAPTLLTWLGLETPENLTPLVGEGRRAQHLFVSFQATKSGLLGNTALGAAPGRPFTPSQLTRQAPYSVLDILPANSLFVTSGNNLSQLFTETAENMGGYPPVQQSLHTFLTALSLPEASDLTDLWQSIQGEYALALMAGQTPTWVLAAAVNAENPFDGIDALAQEQGLTVSQVRLGDRDITAWTRLSVVLTSPEAPASLAAQVVGVHTQVNGYEVLSTSLPGLQQILRVDRNASLANKPGFTQLVKTVERPYGSFAYVDWPQLAPTLFNRLPWLRVLNQAGQPLTPHLGPIFLGGHGSTPALQESTFTMRLLDTP